MMEITLEHYVLLSVCLFCIGLFGVILARKNLITLLMALEVMLLAVNINFVAFSAHFQDMVGQIFCLMILTIAAAEVAIGLAILVILYRAYETVEPSNFCHLKG